MKAPLERHQGEYNVDSQGRIVQTVKLYPSVWCLFSLNIATQDSNMT
jgi:hypothetical protein